MSLLDQERALFDLLFDAEQRERFAKDRSSALAHYELSDTERADFDNVRLDALELDSQMRVDLILQRMCRAMPVSFSLASSLPRGLETLRASVDVSYISAAPSERASLLGRRVREFLVQASFPRELEQSAAVALCDAELSMTVTAMGLRDGLLGSDAAVAPPPPRPDLLNDPLVLAPHVSVALLSQSYSALKRALCPAEDAELWARLCRAPLPAARRSETLAHEAPRLLVARAHCSHRSSCEVTIDHKMLELSAGFAALVQHLDGKMRLSTLLEELKRAGANDKVCDGVRAGFGQLVEHAMLQRAPR